VPATRPDEDPGWHLSPRTLLFLVPGFAHVVRRDRRSTVTRDGLTLIREVWLIFTVSMLLFGVVVVLATGGTPTRPAAGWVAAVAVAAVLCLMTAELSDPLLPTDGPIRGHRALCLRRDVHRGPVVDLLAVPAVHALRLPPECTDDQASQRRPRTPPTGGMQPVTRPSPARTTPLASHHVERASPVGRCATVGRRRLIFQSRMATRRATTRATTGSARRHGRSSDGARPDQAGTLSGCPLPHQAVMSFGRLRIGRCRR
jgi:hypothetical protein